MKKLAQIGENFEEFFLFFSKLPDFYNKFQ